MDETMGDSSRRLPPLHQLSELDKDRLLALRPLSTSIVLVSVVSAGRPAFPSFPPTLLDDEDDEFVVVVNSPTTVVGVETGGSRSTRPT
jgi:hypothetical protein